jgi:polynucleotide 5'-kinase involved in rRNA processing
MEHSDFPPTQPQEERPDFIVNVTREEYLEEIEEHRKSVQILEEQSKDLTRSEEEREEKRKLWLKEKIDLQEMEEALSRGGIMFRPQS